jgi:hypothetical protein
MLLRNDDRGVLAIGQPSHAWLSGQLARTWSNSRFPAPEPYEEVCLAAEQHDVGMAMWDITPGRDSDTGLPYSFMAMRLQDHLRLWSGAPQRLLVQSRYASLLVSMHGWRLYKRRNLDELPDTDAAAVREYLAAQKRWQEELIASFERFDRERLARNSQLIWTWDFISLVICLDWAPRVARDVPTNDGAVDIEITAEPGERRVRLDPWPLAAHSATVRCEGRRLTGRYETDEALRCALAAAPWETLEFELTSA